jgi:DNA-binding IclR family transcriptional regulator
MRRLKTEFKSLAPGQRRTTGRPRTANREAVGIQSVEIALDVLSTFLTRDKEISLTELSQATGLAASKLHRYLVSLSRYGMIVRSEAGQYDLGPAARTLGAVALTRFDEFDLINEEVKRLSASIRESVFVYTWSESGPILVRSYSIKQTLVALKVGSMLPVLDSGCGPVFLACLPREWTESVVQRELRDSGAKAISIDKLVADIRDELARDGAISVENGLFVPGGWVAGTICAAPIFDLLGELTAVIGATATGTSDPSEAKRSVASSAASLSKAIGHRSKTVDVTKQLILS